MSEGQILGRRRDELMLHTLALRFSQIGKSERLECMSVFVEHFVVVYRSRSYNYRGALWYKRAVRECKVFQRLTQQIRWWVE